MIHFLPSFSILFHRSISNSFCEHFFSPALSPYFFLWASTSTSPSLLFPILHIFHAFNLQFSPLLTSPFPSPNHIIFSYLSTVMAASTAKRRALILVAYKSNTPALTEHTGSHASISYPIVSVLGPKWDACMTCIEVVGSPSIINRKDSIKRTSKSCMIEGIRKSINKQKWKESLQRYNSRKIEKLLIITDSKKRNDGMFFTSRVFCERSWDNVKSFSELSDGILVKTLDLICECWQSDKKRKEKGNGWGWD